MNTPPPPRMSRRGVLKLGAAGLGMLGVGGLTAACGQPTAATGTNASGAKEVVFATTKLPSTTSFAEWVQAYNSSQNNYFVTVRELAPPSSNTEVHQQLVQSLSRKDGSVDVFSQDIVWIAEFANAGWAMKLDGELDRTAVADAFPGIVSGCTFQGALTAAPWVVDSGQFYYRTDLIAEADVPTTWDQVISQAQQLTASGQAEYGYLWQAKQAEILVCNLVEFIGSAGGSILGEDSVTVNIAEEPAIRAVTLMHDMMNGLGITPKDVLSWDEEPSRRPFTSGQAAMLRQWSYVYGVSQDTEQSSVAGKVNVAPLPSFADGRSSACLGGFQLGVAESSANKDGALDFVNWALSTQAQISFARDFGQAPARSEAYDDATFIAEQPSMVALKPVFTNVTPRPVTPLYPQVSLALQSSISRALNSGDIEGELTACKAAIEKIVQA